MNCPEIATSTREEREQFIINEFRCLADCDLCGKCAMLHGGDALQIYADYINGKRSFREITMELRR